MKTKNLLFILIVLLFVTSVIGQTANQLTKPEQDYITNIQKAEGFAKTAVFQALIDDKGLSEQNKKNIIKNSKKEDLLKVWQGVTFTQPSNRDLKEAVTDINKQRGELLKLLDTTGETSQLQTVISEVTKAQNFMKPNVKDKFQIMSLEKSTFEYKFTDTNNENIIVTEGANKYTIPLANLPSDLRGVEYIKGEGIFYRQADASGNKGSSVLIDKGYLSTTVPKGDVNNVAMEWQIKGVYTDSTGKDVYDTPIKVNFNGAKNDQLQVDKEGKINMWGNKDGTREDIKGVSVDIGGKVFSPNSKAPTAEGDDRPFGYVKPMIDNTNPKGLNVFSLMGDMKTKEIGFVSRDDKTIVSFSKDYKNSEMKVVTFDQYDSSKPLTFSGNFNKEVAFTSYKEGIKVISSGGAEWRSMKLQDYNGKAVYEYKNGEEFATRQGEYDGALTQNPKDAVNDPTSTASGTKRVEKGQVHDFVPPGINAPSTQAGIGGANVLQTTSSNGATTVTTKSADTSELPVPDATKPDTSTEAQITKKFTINGQEQSYSFRNWDDNSKTGTDADGVKWQLQEITVGRSCSGGVCTPEKTTQQWIQIGADGSTQGTSNTVKQNIFGKGGWFPNSNSCGPNGCTSGSSCGPNGCN